MRQWLETCFSPHNWGVGLAFGVQSPGCCSTSHNSDRTVPPPKDYLFLSQLPLNAKSAKVEEPWKGEKGRI